jgi:hypothetical protein
MFCATGLVFGVTEGVGTRFHVLCFRTRFRRYRGRPFQISCFPLLDMFSAVPRAWGPFFMFCAPGLIFGCTVGVGSRFAFPGTSCPVFLFCAPELFFGISEGVGSRFHVLCARTHFRRYRGRRVPFSCFARPYSFVAVPRASSPVFLYCSPGLVFDGAEGVVALFHVLRSRTRFRWYRGRRVPFSRFTFPD